MIRMCFAAWLVVAPLAAIALVNLGCGGAVDKKPARKWPVSTYKFTPAAPATEPEKTDSKDR
jgi:hypothetical protein